ncbi:MAG: D-aminoacyl-tRNA deacylase [Nitrososphaerales archaeon]
MDAEGAEYILVASIKDKAGCNIASSLRSKYGFRESSEHFEGYSVFDKDGVKLIYTEREIIYADHLDYAFKPKAYIFLSRHSSEKGIPCLTAHFPGNLGADSSYGGKPKEPSITYPSLLKRYIKELWLRRNEVKGYQVVLEPMHHGPSSLKKPCMFVEVGSTPLQWADTHAASVVADSLWSALCNNEYASKIGLGFGGTHYSSKFTQLLVESEYALGAVASKHMLKELTVDTVRLMVSRCVEDVNYAILDWKGLSTEKQNLLSIIDEVGLEVVRI